MGGGARVLPLAIGPKEVFKHVILTTLLKSLTSRFNGRVTVFDFNPGPGKFTPIDNGLTHVFNHVRQSVDKKEISFFQDYVAALLRVNGEKDPRALKLPPPLGHDFSTYPSNAGLEKLLLRETDRMVLVEENQDVRDRLSAFVGDDSRVSILSSTGLDTSLYKGLVPPINHRGMVVFDVDALLLKIPASGEFKSQFLQTHQDLVEQAGSVLSMMVKRWPTGTFYIPYPMSSHIPPVSFIRTILKSGAKQVLNCSMFLEGKKGVEFSAPYAGEGIGCLIVNPPALVDLDLHTHLPILKTEVFMPHVRLEDEERATETLVAWLGKALQPWEDVESSATKQTWEYVRGADLSDAQKEMLDTNKQEKSDKRFADWLIDDEEQAIQEMYAGLETEPQPVPFDPNDEDDQLHRLSWAKTLKEQSVLQDQVRPTVVKVPRARKAQGD